jgi:hypothetical protein
MRAWQEIVRFFPPPSPQDYKRVKRSISWHALARDTTGGKEQGAVSGHDDDHDLFDGE